MWQVEKKERERELSVWNLGLVTLHIGGAQSSTKDRKENWEKVDVFAKKATDYSMFRGFFVLNSIYKKTKMKNHSNTCILLSCVYLAPIGNGASGSVVHHPDWYICIKTYAQNHTSTHIYNSQRSAHNYLHPHTHTHRDTQQLIFTMFVWHLLLQ